jgi:peptidoglycan/LPS O-acetylase OafA/YrhL
MPAELVQEGASAGDERSLEPLHLGYRPALDGLRGVSVLAVNMGLDTRADSILIGCALAMILRWRMAPGWAMGRAARRVAGTGGALALCCLLAMARYPTDLLAHSASTLTALASALLISELLVAGSRLAGLLELRPLVGVGRISYGLYLWHFPIFVLFSVLLTQTTTLDPVRLGLAWALTFAVCLASFRLLELPALRLKVRLSGATASRELARPAAIARDAAPIAVTLGGSPAESAPEVTGTTGR